MTPATLARVLAAGLAALAAALAASDLAGHPDRSVERRGAAAAPDPLTLQLRACQAEGEAAARDPGCSAAWARQRRRFLGTGATDAAGGR